MNKPKQGFRAAISARLTLDFGALMLDFEGLKPDFEGLTLNFGGLTGRASAALARPVDIDAERSEGPTAEPEAP
jgi:hypothetical protein